MLEHQKKRYACGQCLPAPKESCVASFYQHQRRVVWPVFTSTKGELCGQFLPTQKESCVARFYQHQRRGVWPVFTSTKGGVWPVFTGIQRKMYGKMEQLKKMAPFFDVGRVTV